MPPDAPRLIEWHRVDVTRGRRGVFYLAAVLVTVGAAGIGGAFMQRLAGTRGQLVALAGLCVTLAGLVLAVTRAIAMLQIDAYLAVRDDGVVLHWSSEREVVIAWERIRAIQGAAAGEIVFALDDGTRESWTFGDGAVELARHLKELQNKAAHGLLPR